MDSDQLRLILLALGATLVVAIFLWDRYKRSRHQLRPMPRHVQHHSFARDDEDDFVEDDDLPSMLAEETIPLQLTEEDTVLLDDDSELQPEFDLDFSAIEERDESLPQLVVQIALVREDNPITGTELDQSMEEVGLKHGEMDIYHRYDEKQEEKIWFSVASLVEPGRFPFADMDSFTTPGVLLFTQLPGVRDGMMIYAEMLFVAERLAGLMDAKLQDDTHSTLGKQTIEHTKDAILEHRRKVQLARKR